MGPCPDGFQPVPEKFHQDQIRQTSKFGRFLQKQAKATRVPGIAASGMTKWELLNDVLLNPDVSIQGYLDGYALGRDTGFSGKLYEAMWDIAIKLDRLPNYTSQLFHHCTGRIENGGLLTPMHTKITKAYLVNEPVATGNRAGISDITLQAKDVHDVERSDWVCNSRTVAKGAGTYVLFSCKYYMREKRIQYYDISEIIEVMEYYRNKIAVDAKYNIVLLVRNRAEFMLSLERSSKRDLFGGMIIDVFDVNTLVDIVAQMRADADAIVQQLLHRSVKPSLEPRFHQLLFVNKTLDRIVASTPQGFVPAVDPNGPNQVLWGQIARSGKTYTAGLLVSRLDQGGFFRNTGQRNVVLVITPAPTETVDQFKKDLFEKYREFDGFEVAAFDSKFRQRKLDPKKKYILIASKQYLQGSRKKSTVDQGIISEDVATLEEIEETRKNIGKVCEKLADRVSLIVFDEIHYGGSTEISKLILSTIDPKNVAIRIFLTATYLKPVQAFAIPENRLLVWGLHDIHLCKYIANERAYDELCAVHGVSDVYDTIRGLCQMYVLEQAETLQMIEREYRRYPDVHVMTSMFDEKKVRSILADNPNAYGFDLAAVFEIKGERFIQEENVEKLLAYVSGTLYPRMETVLQDYKQARGFTSQLWFMPYFKGNRVKNVCARLKTILANHKDFRDYAVITATDPGDNKDTIRVAEFTAYAQGKRGLIILVGKKFSVGVSLPCVDAVFFMNNDTDVDIIYQRMFRSLTESPGKRVGFVVDVNPFRSISVFIGYGLPNARDRPPIKRIETLIENRSIYIDSDLIHAGTGGITRKDLYSHIKGLIAENLTRQLGTELERSTQSMFLGYFGQHGLEPGMLALFGQIKVAKKRQMIEKANRMGLDHARRKADADGDADADADADAGTDGRENSNTTALTYIGIAYAWTDLLLLCAVLVAGKKNGLSFGEVMERVADYDCTLPDTGENDDIAAFAETFQQKLYPLLAAKSSQQKCADMRNFVRVSRKHFEQNNVLAEYNELYDRMKEQVNIEASDINRLHSFVERYLTPKEHEKKEFGEVFTPLRLVNDMLDGLERYGKRDIWTDPSIRILDPAAGIGNFPLIAYERLMKGLKSHIPNEEKRRRHILENMLYMIELNGNNVRLLKKIFNSDKYKLNLLCTDSLVENESDVKALPARKRADARTLLEWKTNIRFDVIIGNPPFQAPQKAEGKRGGGDSLWNHFVISSINWLADKGWLVFVHPSGWRKPETASSKFAGLFRLMTKTNCMKYLEIHGSKDGQAVFQSGTRYDWYVIHKTKCNSKTVIQDELGYHISINMKDWNWLPNYNFEKVRRLVATPSEPTCNVIYSSSAYGSDKAWVKDKEWIENHKEQAKGYKCIIVHTTPSDKTRFLWTNAMSKDVEYDMPMFGISKVIFGDSGINNAVLDAKGKYGLSQHAIGIAAPVMELESLKQFLESHQFQLILQACMWSNFQIDWRMFAAFKDGFWKVKLDPSPA